MTVKEFITDIIKTVQHEGDFYNLQILEDIFNEIKYKNEYEDELYKNGLMDKRAANRYIDGYVDGLSYAIKAMGFFTEKKDNLQGAVNCIVDAYNESCELEQPLIEPNTLLKLEVQPGYPVTYGIVLESKSYKNRNNQVKTIVRLVSTAVDKTWRDPDEFLYKIDIKGIEYEFNIYKEMYSTIYSYEDKVKICGHISQDIIEHQKTHNKEMEDLYSDLP